MATEVSKRPREQRQSPSLREFLVHPRDEAARIEPGITGPDENDGVFIARLTSILKTFLRERHGKKSEKLGSDAEDQRSFVFEEIETGIAAVQALVDRGRDPATKSKRDPHQRWEHAENLGSKHERLAKITLENCLFFNGDRNIGGI